MRKDYVAYVGKSLRINLDGSIPNDNPKPDGVLSHVYTYGHRNPQGIDFGPDGTLYASEQGPKTDDEVNILKPGSNYGWPNVAGSRTARLMNTPAGPKPPRRARNSGSAISRSTRSVPREPESAFKKPFVNPIATMFTVPTGYNFHDPLCKGIDFICWPTVGASSIEYYASKGKGIPGWDTCCWSRRSNAARSMSCRSPPTGKPRPVTFRRYFQSENRYRDTAIIPDGRTIYIATDPGGLAEALGGGTTRNAGSGSDPRLHVRRGRNGDK